MASSPRLGYFCGSSSVLWELVGSSGLVAAYLPTPECKKHPPHLTMPPTLVLPAGPLA